MLLEQFSNDKPIFTAESFVNRVKNCPKIAVGFFSQSIEDTFIKMFNPKVFTKMRCSGEFNVYEVEYNGKRVLFYRSALGAPATVMIMEELACMGVENFLMSGTCGVLVDLPEYSLIVPNRAIRDEGTSYHYAPFSDYVELDKIVVDNITKYLDSQQARYVVGTTWTTDAMYRETADKVNNRKSMRAMAVDMECSAMATFAKYKGVKFGQILYGADVVIEGKHDLRTLLNGQASTEGKIINLVLDCATTIF